MQKFEWDESFSVGVKLIDEQHKVWIERLNGVSAAIESHQESRHISKTLNFMMDYVEFHFAAEESLMAAQIYPGLEQHKLGHQEFRNTLMDLLVLEFEDDDCTGRIADSINNFQISWLKNHIQQTDRQFADFLREKAAARLRETELALSASQPGSAANTPDAAHSKNPAW